MRLRRCRPVASLLLVMHVSACATWRPSPAPPRQLIEQEQPSSVRLTLTSGEVVTLQDPSMTSDSIVGLVGGGFVDGVFTDVEFVVAVASRDVVSMEVRRLSAGRTFAAVVLGGVALVGVAMVIFIVSLPRCEAGGNVGPCR